MIIKAQRISYSDKVAINTNSNVADINKCNASDLNEIKSVVNTNATALENVETEAYDKNVMTIGLSANTNVSIGTAWTYYALNLNTLNASIGSKLTFNSSTHRITIGSGVSYVKVSACGIVRGIASDMEINIRKNGTIIGACASRAGNTSIFMPEAITDVLVPVSSGDYIDLAVRAGATGTMVVGGSNYTKLTVEVVD